MSNLTIRPLNTGFIPTNSFQYHFHHSVAPYLKDVPNEKIPLPVFVYLVEGGDQLLLVDTGMSPTDRANEYHHPGSWQDDDKDIESLLNSVGYQCEDVDIVVLTHLHWDHMFYLEKFKHARIVVNKKEYDFAMDPIPLYYKSYEAPILGVDAPFRQVEIETVLGEVEIMPGVRVFETPGHSPGHQSVEIDCEDGHSYICAGDSIFVIRNLDPVPQLHYNITPPGRFYNIVETWKSIELQKERAESPDHLLLCHDKNMLDRVKETPIIGKKETK